jgi:antirestriction protein ArdC
VKKGEKSTPVIYYKFLEKRNDAGNLVAGEDGKQSRIPFVRWSNVFNLDETEGITSPAIAVSQNTAQPLERATALVDSAKLCPIHHGGFAAYYSSKDDVIRIPAPSTFHSQEDYYHSLYHEMTHAAGHSSRLNREGITQQAKFGSERYSHEELIAELGAAFLSNEVVDVGAAHLAWLANCPVRGLFNFPYHSPSGKRHRGGTTECKLLVCPTL